MATSKGFPTRPAPLKHASTAAPPLGEILDNDVPTALSSLLPPADLVQGCVANAEP